MITRRPRLAAALAVALAAALTAVAIGEPAVAAPAQSPTGRWIVHLDGPSLAAQQSRGGRADLRSAAARAYADKLAVQHKTVGAAIDKRLKRPVKVTGSLRHVVNALVVEASAAEAARLAGVAGVAAVEPDAISELTTDVSHELIGSPTIWGGDTGSQLSTRGEGVVVGILDSGINAFHPSFAATDGEGYTHTNPYGRYLGVCDPAHPNYDPICNSKLVGAYSFVSGNSARDTNGHGSHTASTAAGNRHSATLVYGPDTVVRTVQGVAPRANIVAYRVCIETCPNTSILAGINQAVIDGVDVLNYSISGADAPWSNTISRAFLEAFGAGVFISMSAGNSGPGAGTVAHTAPWNASVAATTTDRTWAKSFEVLGPAPVPAAIARVSGWPGFGPGNAAPIEAQLRYSGEVGTATGCSAFPAGSLAGAVALIPTGTCATASKITNAANAGAVAVVLFERQPGPPVFISDAVGTAIPAISVTQAAGEALQAFATATTDPVPVRLGATTELARDGSAADTVAWFSSRGPSDFDLLAPTLSAPGVNILAAYKADGADAVQYNIIRGTSMASPHVAGAGALMAALHPDWSPAQIRSALAGTADPDGVRDENGAPADPLESGAGRLDLAAAGRVGLTMHETYANMLAANPATGGVPRNLNVPYLVNRQCNLACSWTRTVTNVADTATTYSASVAVPAGMVATVTPSSFSLAPGESRELTVDVDVRGSSGGAWAFADLRITTGGSHAGGTPIAGVHYPVAVIPVAPAMSVDPTSIEVSQKPGRTANRSVTIRNTGNGALTWRADGCPLPAWLAATPSSGSLNPGVSTQVRLTIDSTGLTPGRLTAALCVDGNDPAKPNVQVAVALTVLDLPTMTVSEELSITQPAGTVTGTPLIIGNTGTAALDWTIGEAPVAVDAAALTGLAADRQDLLRDGVLLIPNTAVPGVAAFDPQTGDLLDPAFITYPQSLGTTTHIILNAAQDGFLVSSQSENVVYGFGLDGAFQGIVAPAGGENTAIMSNVRGMAISPWGTLLVASGTGNKVVEFDTAGNYLRDFVASGAGGISGPWYIHFRADDVLVSASGGNIYRYDHAGNPLSTWNSDINFPQQLAPQDDGTLLAAAFSSPAGVWHLDPGGALINRYTGVASNRGVQPLGNGNILTTNSGGVHEIDRGSAVVETELASTGVRMISKIERSQPCDEPADVPWLRVEPAGGTTPAGGTSQVTVLVDTTGLAPGVHEAHLCVTGNDPERETASVPVTVTVQGSCDRTVTGTHAGPLAVTSGLTCLAHGATVTGRVTIASGAALYADGAHIDAALAATGAAGIELTDTLMVGALTIKDGTGIVTLARNHVIGRVALTGNSTGTTPVLVSGNTIDGPLMCSGNQPPPVNGGVPNTVSGTVTGQCRGL